MSLLTADDILAPKGELEVDWFAPLDAPAVSARLNEWLNEGYTKSPTTFIEQQKNDVAKAWGYYSAYKHIASALARKPATLSITEGSDSMTRTFTANEVDHFTEMRDSWYSVFNALIPFVEISDRTPTMSVRARFRF